MLDRLNDEGKLVVETGYGLEGLEVCGRLEEGGHASAKGIRMRDGDVVDCGLCGCGGLESFVGANGVSEFGGGKGEKVAVEALGYLREVDSVRTEDLGEVRVCLNMPCSCPHLS